MQTVGTGKIFRKVLFMLYTAVILSCIAHPFAAFGADKLVVKDPSGNIKFVARDDGKIGIGIANPLAALHVVPYNNAIDAMYGEMVSDSGWATFKLLHARGTTSNKTAVFDGDILGRFVMWGHDGTAYNRSASFEASVDGSPTLGSTPGRLTFSTVPAGSGNLVERMRITSSGNVGIGTSAPTTLLDVNSNGIRIRSLRTPASAGASCNQGEMAWDAAYVYVCVAQNSWKRANLATW